MPATGKLDRRVTIERHTTARNDFGEPVKTYATYTTIWAERRDMSDGEAFAAGEIEAVRKTRFIVRARGRAVNITAADRLVESSVTYEIKGVKETNEGRKRFIELTCVARND